MENQSDPLKAPADQKNLFADEEGEEEGLRSGSREQMVHSALQTSA